MSRGSLALRCAEHLIRAACRALPEAEREDRELEWIGEAEAVACDPDIRFPILRAVHTLWYASSLLLHIRAARAKAPERRQSMLRRRSAADPAMITRAVCAVVAAAMSAGSGGLMAYQFGFGVSGLLVAVSALIVGGTTAALIYPRRPRAAERRRQRVK